MLREVDFVGEALCVNNWKGEALGYVRPYYRHGGFKQGWAWTTWVASPCMWKTNHDATRAHARTAEEAAAYLLYDRERIVIG